MNELTIVGNLTADPVLRMSANGRGVVRFDVAINHLHGASGSREVG